MVFFEGKKKNLVLGEIFVFLSGGRKRIFFFFIFLLSFSFLFYSVWCLVAWNYAESPSDEKKEERRKGNRWKVRNERET